MASENDTNDYSHIIQRNSIMYHTKEHFSFKYTKTILYAKAKGLHNNKMKKQKAKCNQPSYFKTVRGLNYGRRNNLQYYRRYITDETRRAVLNRSRREG